MDVEIYPSSLTRITHTQIKTQRESILKQQRFRCGLCDEDLDPQEAVLDHDHRTGRIRRVLHRGCNALLGKIENNMIRNRISEKRLSKICDNLSKYIKDNWTELQHPSYKEKSKTKR